MPEPLRRRAADYVSLETLDLRVTALEAGMESIRHDLTQTVSEIQANTRLTEEVHGNTAELIQAMGDLKVLGRWGKRLAIAAKYGTYVLAFIAAGWAYIAHK